MHDISQIFRDAADVIRTRGWCQGHFTNHDGRCCYQGAVYKALAGADWRNNDDLITAVFARMKQITGGVPPLRWNDAPGRTKEEVIAALERAAEIGEPEKRRVLVPSEVPVAPMTPDSPLWTEPAPEEPKRAPAKEPA